MSKDTTPVELHTIALSTADLDTLFECVSFARRACDGGSGRVPEVVQNLKGLERLLMRADNGVRR